MKRSKFSLSHYRLGTYNMGSLYPISVMEVLPGDTIQQATSMLVRCSPLLAPVMHPVRVRVHHWYVPYRLLWDNWEDFITGGPTGTDTSVFPTITAGGTGFAVGSLGDHMGLPTGLATLQVNALPFRAYAMIWNENYRDQDLETELVFSTASGPDSTTSRALQNVSWEKDYFTSARPFEQKGPAITIPLGTSAPVNPSPAASAPTFHTGTGTPTTLRPAATTASSNVQISGPTSGTTALQWGTPGLAADLSNASAITISRLREAFALQRFEEARARYGSRYVEYLRYLGVRSSDARLQRPEYLGGGRQTIQFSEVLQTAEGEDPVGEMRGHGIGAMRSNRYRRFFEEHGVVLSLLSVQPKTMYMQGVHKQWIRRSREDFWQRELQHIGQQEVENQEVYAAHAQPTGVFGYQDRYDEYRRKESSVAGEFRTSLLNYWHLARDFSSAPALNASFVSCVPTERIFADNAEDTLYIMANHSIQARRMVVKTGKSFIY
ncbi:major capsid protein [Flyfo microvirus Tbat2_144]|nr:major capsid protein [Flyfo microvirus Tbat2_144]